MERFTNEEEANRCLITFLNQPPPFCPIINDTCRHDCICFTEASIATYYEHGRWRGPKDDQDKAIAWQVYPNRCEHALITCELLINQ